MDPQVVNILLRAHFNPELPMQCAPSISIILPTRDSARFLEERLSSIRRQTVSDWEVVVIDGESTDGTWETLADWARQDSRVRLERRQPDGIYPAINHGIDLARGEFIYIATSDDSMEPRCLEKLRAALCANPDCGIAQCCLHAIDGSGKVIEGWWQLVGAARFLGPIYLRAHKRLAPYDAVLHATMHTIYHSLTQILVKKRVFATTGHFPLRFGSAGDYCWGMKAGLTTAVVHVPEFLATWRLHPVQASAGYRRSTAERARVLDMLDEAFAHCGDATGLPLRTLRAPCEYQRIRQEYSESGKHLARARYLFSLLRRSPKIALRLLVWGRRREPDPVFTAQKLIRICGLENHLQMLPAT